MKLIAYFNGKKTMIGAALLFAAAFFDQVVIGYYGATSEWIAPTIKTLEWFGMPLTGVGLSHKGYKFFSNDTKQG